MKRRTALFLFAVVLGCAAAPLARAQEPFTFQTFTIPNVVSLSVDGINDFGILSGTLTDTLGTVKGWVRDPYGHVTPLVEPQSNSIPTETTANQINNLGVVVGSYLYSSNPGGPGATLTTFGYFYFAGYFASHYTAPGMVPGGFTVLVGINNVGGFCGFTANPPIPPNTQSITYAFVAINGIPTEFSIPGATATYCQAINDQGVAAGFYIDAQGEHGWVRKPNGDTRTVDVPGASYMKGSNQCSTSPGGTDILGINNAGEVSGHFYDSSYLEHGFVQLPDGTFKDFDAQVPQEAGPPAYLTGGGGVNNLGQVSGHYLDEYCNPHGFIATPKKH
jgi:hypothetical protein